MAYETAPVEVLSDISSGNENPYLGQAEFDDHPQDECGVYGVYAPGEPVIRLTVAALEGLQHRGQSGAGIAFVENERSIIVVKEEGLVPEALSAIYPSARNRNGAGWMTTDSPLAIGHVRYSTANGEGHFGAHPHLGHKSNIALVHNGELHNMDIVANKFDVSAQDVAETAGIRPEFVTDSALLTEVLDVVAARHNLIQAGLAAAAARTGDQYVPYDSLKTALEEVLPLVDGAYCLSITDGKRLLAACDPWGLHPLSLGRSDRGYMVASENVIFDSLGATYERDIEPGEILIIDEAGAQSSYIDRVEETRRCGFEYIYTARPDGELAGANVFLARKNMGRYLAEDNVVDADIVVGVPSSGLAAAAGYAEVSGFPKVEGIFLNRYSGRTFIERAETGRENKIANKYHMNTSELVGKRVVLVDDSVVKGNTMRQLVKMVRDGGATEVHVRSSAARYQEPCHMGMDTHNPDLLIAHGRTNDEIAKYVGADSIAFNTPKRIQQAVEAAIIDPAKRSKLGTLCTACTTGEYPFAIRPNQATLLGMPVVREAVELTAV